MSKPLNHELSGVHLSLLMNLEAHYCDEEQRPLGENKVPYEYQMAVPMELAECPYSGSRYKHFRQMNTSALKQMTTHWTSIIQGFKYLRSCYLQQYSQNKVDALGLYRLSVAGYLMPSYLFYRAEQPYQDGALPAGVAVLYKAALGMVNAAQVLITKTLLTDPQHLYDQISAEKFYDFADQEGLLIGPWEVCAGPPSMIKEVLKVMAEPQIEPYSHWPLIPNLATYLSYSNEAAKVLLLDALTPLCYYYFLYDYDKELLNRFFELCQADSPSPTFAGELSLELQLLRLTSPILASLSVSDYQKLQQATIKLWTILGPTIEIEGLLDRQASDNSRIKEYTTKISEFLSSGRVKMPIDRTPAEIYTIAEILANYLILERKKLLLYTEYQGRMNQILGRGSVDREIDGWDLSRMYNRKLRDVLADLLAIEITNSTTQSKLQQVGQVLILDS